MTVRPLQAVLFDWGDTLVHVPGLTTDPTGHEDCLRRLFTDPVCPCIAKGQVGWDAFMAAYREISATQVRFSAVTLREHRVEDRLAGALRVAGCGCSLEPKETARLAQTLREAMLAACQAVAGAREVLNALSGLIPLGVVSNHPDPRLVEDSLARCQLREPFDTVIVSGDSGWLKPDSRPFLRALRILDVEADQTLFVGDNLETDIAGARKIGLRVAWLAEARQPEHPLKQLSQLPELLELCTEVTKP